MSAGPLAVPPVPPVLRGDRVTLRHAVPADRAGLREILAEPSVARWWGTDSAAAAADDVLDETGHTAFVIEVDGRVAGAILCSEEEEPDYRHASIDIFLATAEQGRGFGPDALRTLLRWVFTVRGHHRVTIDPALANVRAIATYRKVGFRPVGVMRRYERGRDGTWHDGLLMEMLAGDRV